MTLTDTATEVSTTTPKKLQLGFLNNVPFTDSAPGGSAQGLKDAVELFRIAEKLGYDKGWVRNRHFDNYLSSPLTLLAVAAQHTERIRLGTAIIPMGYENPIRLAEDAATVDLLTDRRLELGIATGIPSFQKIFGYESDVPWKVAAQQRVDSFVAAVRGEVLDSSPVGEPFYVRPHSPSLVDRIWYGPGSVATATQAGAAGLDLLLSALGPDTGGTFEEGQLAQILAHRAAWSRTDRGPRVSAARLFFPVFNDRQRKLYQDYADLRAAEGPAASRPAGALAPGSTIPPPPADGKPAGPPGYLASPVVVADPAEVIEYLRNDVAVAEAGELMIFLPPGFSHPEYVEILENIAEHVAGDLGWTPAQ